jgi:competence protein ComEA
MKRSIPAIVLAGLLVSVGALADPVNINTADARTLAKELNGIGLSRAQAIVDYREKNGPFKNADELAKVKGIGMKVVEQNRTNIRVEKADKSKAAAAKPADKSAASE